MKGEIFISGGGNIYDSFSLDEEFIKSVGKRKILYIPIGLIRSYIGFEECYDWFKGMLQQHTNKPPPTTMVVNLKNIDKNVINKYGAIYIGGGKNTYRLLNLLHENRLTDLLVKYSKNGGILYGGSAGAVIMGKNIATVIEENDLGYSKENGLGLVGDYSILCHYNSASDDKLKKYIETYKNPVIALSEKSGIVVKDENVDVVGKENIKIFWLNSVQTLQPGQNFIINEQTKKN